MSITKISRHTLRRLINEATKKANNWAEYVATGKDNTSKTLRKKIQIKWSLVAGNDKLYPENQMYLIHQEILIILTTVGSSGTKHAQLHLRL